MVGFEYEAKKTINLNPVVHYLFRVKVVVPTPVWE